MTKKKKIDIAGRLNALKPSVPTRTRIIESGIAKDPESKESIVSEKISQTPFETLSLFHENMAIMEKLGNSILKDTRRFQSLFFESFTNIFTILYETMHTNMNFVSKLRRRIQR
jgi:hypothetical protein